MPKENSPIIQISIIMIPANKFRIDAHVIDLIWNPNEDLNLDIQPKRQSITTAIQNIIEVFLSMFLTKIPVLSAKWLEEMKTFTFKLFILDDLAQFVRFWFTRNTQKVFIFHTANNSNIIYNYTCVFGIVTKGWTLQFSTIPPKNRTGYCFPLS